MTSSISTATAERSLEEVERLFKAWRKSRKHFKPIPAELLDAAVSLSGKHSIHNISKRLLIDPTELKKRVHTSRTHPPETDIKKRDPASCTHPPIKTMPGPAFVELDFGAAQTQKHNCTITMEDQSGAKMEIHIDDARQFDVNGICKTFWSRRI